MAAPRYDVEMLMGDLKTILTTYLNGIIVGINTEKNDSIVLKQIDPQAYFLQDINHNLAINFDPFIYLGVEGIKTMDSLGPSTSRLYTIPVLVVIADEGQEPAIAKRLYRYWRALEDVFAAHWNDSNFAVPIKLSFESLVPVAWKDEMNDTRYKCAGVSLMVALT